MPRRIRGKLERKVTYIKQWREHRGLTQEKLAERIGMSKAQLSRIESGEQPYTQDVLELIAEELQTDPASLIMRDPSKPEPMWSIWEKAKPGVKRQIEEVARVLDRTSKAG